MKTFTRSFLLVVLVLAVANIYAQKGEGDEKLMKKIQATNNKMVKAMIADDTEKVLSFYTPQAVSMPNYGKILRGLDAIAKDQREASAMGYKITDMTLTTKNVQVYGDAVVEVGVYKINMEVPQMPQPISDEGKYLAVWEKQKDGSYKMAYDIWNTDSNPMIQRSKGALNPASEGAPKLEKSK